MTSKKNSRTSRECRGPRALALEQREAVTLALAAIHQVPTPFIEGVPVKDGTRAVFRRSRQIRSDTITVIFKPWQTA